MAAVLTATLVADGFISSAQGMIDVTSKLVVSLTTAYNTVQKMENTLLTSSGSLQQSRKDIVELRSITDRLGVSLEAAATPFAKFAASAKDLTREARFEVFEGFTTALSATHAGAQQVTGTFLALQQIMSKGKVNMQDLRRQLAEHIPGAMDAARRAFGDGTASMEEFEDAVASGMVDANTWVVKFANIMREDFGAAAAEAAQTLNAELERIGNSFLIFQSNIVASSQAAETWKSVLISLQENVLDNVGVQEDLSEALGNSNKAVQHMVDIAPELIELFSTMAERASTGIGALSTVVGGVLNKVSQLKGVLSDAGDSLGQLWDEANGSLEKQVPLIEAVTMKVHKYSSAAAALAQIEAEEDKKAADRMQLAISAAEVKTKIAEAEKGRLAQLQELYDETGIATEEYLEKMRVGYEKAALKFKEFMTEAERLAWVNEQMGELDGSTAAAAEAAKKLAAEEKKAATEAAKLKAEQEKAAAATEKAAKAAAVLAANEKKAADAARKAADAKREQVDYSNREVGEEGAYSSGGSGAGGGFSGTMSAHGGALTDEEWQALPQYQKDMLTQDALKGSSSYDYFSRGTGSRFTGEQGHTQDSLAQRASFFSKSQENRAANEEKMHQVINNFNSSISRSDVTNIIEESERSMARS